MKSGSEPAAPGRIHRISDGLRRTRESIFGRFTSLFDSSEAGSEAWLDELETALIEADLGPQTAADIVEQVRSGVGASAPTIEWVRDAARKVLKSILGERKSNDPLPVNGPMVTLVVGVNGSGKTTTAGKIAGRLRSGGQRVLLCAADTFRAGAGEQLRIWAERTGADFAPHRSGADPSSIVYDAASIALARGADALIVDTAGRLHTQNPLMRELEKMVRVVGQRIDGAPHEVLLVLDATTGQNGVNQAREFLAFARVSGLVLTKLDGTARGGVAVRIVQELGIPLRFVGVGEGPEDLVEFDPDEFLEGLLPSAA